MKNFSKKNLTKAFAFLLGGTLCFAAAGALSVEDASASSTLLTPEQIAAATTNVEDMINSTADFNITQASNNMAYPGGYLNWNTGNQTLNGYYILAENVVTNTAGNIVDYDGNLAVWNNGPTTKTQSKADKTSWYTGTGFQLVNGTDYAETAGDGYGFVRFRTNFEVEHNVGLSLGMMNKGQPTLSTYAAGYGGVRHADTKYGYHFTISSSGVVAAYEWKTNASKITTLTAPTLEQGVTLSDGDILDITYGVYKYSDTSNVLYLDINKWDKTNEAWVDYCSYEYQDADITDNAFEASGKYFTIHPTKSNADGTTYEGILLAGIDEPILTGDMAWTETTAITAGTKLSDVTLSKKGYTFANGDATVAIGENTCTATLTDYYGQTTDVTATVTLTGTPDFAAATTNIEDMVNSYEDVNFIQGNTGGSYSGSDVDWNGDGGKAGNMWAHWASKKDSNYQDASPYLDYDGNLAVWTKDSSYYYSNDTAEGHWWGVGFNLVNQTEYGKTNGEGYGIVRFRTKWDSTWTALELGILVRPNSGYVSYDSNGGRGGYVLKLMQDGVKWSEDRINGTSSKYAEITSAVPTYKEAPAEGDLLDISYGVLKNGETHIIYLKMDKWTATGSTNICEFVYTDSDLTDNFYNTSGKCFAIRPMGYVYKASPNNDGLLLAGVNEPILTDVAAEAKALDGIEADETDGTLSAVALGDGYAWKEGDVVLERGEYEYAATYTYDYYGKSNTIDVKVGVTVTGVRTTLQLKDGDTVIKSVELKTGETFTLNSVTLTGVDTVIGWTAADSTDLLKPDYTFTATATENVTVVYNVVDMDMKLLDGASIRTKVDENGVGGIRFVAMFNSADWAANAAYITSAYGVIVPADDTTYFNNGFTAEARALYADAAYNFVGKNALSYADVNLTEAQAGGYALYTFAMTDVKYKNYNRDFAAMAYVTVTYANNETLVFETAYDAEKNCRSVYDVAVAAIAAHEAQDNALYSNSQLAVLESYIANVVDLAYDSATETFSVVDREQHGFTRPYTYVDGSVNEGNITIVLATAEDSLLAKNSLAPVFVTANGETRRFEATVTYADGQATLTFSVTAA